MTVSEVMERLRKDIIIMQARIDQQSKLHEEVELLAVRLSNENVELKRLLKEESLK